jgi:hypothetical protein
MVLVLEEDYRDLFLTAVAFLVEIEHESWAK